VGPFIKNNISGNKSDNGMADAEDDDEDGEFYCEDMFSEIYDEEEFFLFSVQLHEVIGGDADGLSNLSGNGVSSGSGNASSSGAVKLMSSSITTVDKLVGESQSTANVATSSKKQPAMKTRKGKTTMTNQDVINQLHKKPVIKSLDKALDKNPTRRAAPQKKAVKTKKIAPFLTKVYKYAKRANAAGQKVSPKFKNTLGDTSHKGSLSQGKQNLGSGFGSSTGGFGSSFGDPFSDSLGDPFSDDYGAASGFGDSKDANHAAGNNDFGTPGKVSNGKTSNTNRFASPSSASPGSVSNMTGKSEGQTAGNLNPYRPFDLPKLGTRLGSYQLNLVFKGRMWFQEV